MVKKGDSVMKESWHLYIFGFIFLVVIVYLAVCAWEDYKIEKRIDEIKKKNRKNKD